MEAGQIQAFVDRLLASPDFRVPARRARLLRYLAQRAAAGQAEQINEYAIGVDVFDRPESFDPKTDAVVRAEVRRLRQSLKDYYAATNPTDDVILELPARSYVPVFRARPAVAEIPSRSDPDSPRRSWIWIAVALGLGALAAVVLWSSLTPAPPQPPPFSLAVLPAKVTPAAAVFADRADSFSQELAAALWSTRGLSVLEWMKVSSYRGTSAVNDARARLPVALILETEIDRREPGMQVQLRLFGRTGDKPLWSARAPLPDAGIEFGVKTLAGSYLSPAIERDFNIVAYNRSTGRTRIQPTIATLLPTANPCTAKPPFVASLARADAQVTVGAQALGALSPDTRIEILANGQRAYPSATIHTKAGIPIILGAPAVADLAADTCVLTASSGDAPVYGDSCIVPPAGVSDVRLLYTCAPKARPIDITGLANDANLWNEETFPAGPRILAGVPFLIPDGINRFHDEGGDMRGAQPVTFTIPVRQPHVTAAYLLMNTAWGQPGPASYLAITFAGDGGARFEKKLIGGMDIRDYNRGVYTNTIGGGSRPAFDNGRGQRMDLIEVDLPREFLAQTLETITFTDTGRWEFQRSILWAVSLR